MMTSRTWQICEMKTWGRLSYTICLTLLCVFRDSNFSRGAHRVDASVSVAGVSALIWGLHVVQDQAAVRRRQDVPTVGTHRYTISVVKEELRPISFEILRWINIHGICKNQFTTTSTEGKDQATLNIKVHTFTNDQVLISMHVSRIMALY